ncbi:MAG: poly-beta-1,6-N-acetyl-D-glucosamine N-deacetylase PgaB [bacterium]
MMAILQEYGVGCSVLAKAFRKIIIVLFFLLIPLSAAGADKFITLCYHDIPEVAFTPYDVPRHVFIKQLEYLRQHGYEFISPEKIRLAKQGRAPLPDKAVLLTFDDGYLSFYHFVFPLLKLYRIPAVISIVTSWIDQPDKEISKQLMSWKQIQDVLDSGLVFISSHTHNLHKEIVYNSAGNVGPASSLFRYDPETKSYESEEMFAKRINADLGESIRIIHQKTGKKPYLLTWPYGEFNKLALHEAQKLGFEIIFTLENGFTELKSLERANRNMIPNELGIRDFILALKKGFTEKPIVRAVQIDLDKIVNPASYAESDWNLGLLIDRLVALGVNTVFLQGFCDWEGTGNISSVYFPNRVLPVKMDFLSHAVHQIRIRGIKVYVWMPVLSFELPDAKLNADLKVREYKDGKVKITTSWYRRLSPFDKRTLEIVRTLYRDLAAQVQLDGILFQDDLYLTDEEDFHPAAGQAFYDLYGLELTPPIVSDPEIQKKWVSFKTRILTQYTQELIDLVREYRPGAKFARNIYSEVAINPEAQNWFSQNLADYLKNYEYTVIMAYPQMEGIKNSREVKAWFQRVRKEVDRLQAKEKVVFKIQSYDWKEKSWLKEKTLQKELKFLLAQGIKHLGYYPDDVFINKPDFRKIYDISAKTLP